MSVPRLTKRFLGTSAWSSARATSLVRRRRRRLLLETLESREVFAAFGPGNLVVERIGNGQTLSSAATPINVLELTPAGTLVQTLTTQFEGPNLQTDSGTATSNGYLNTYNGFLAVPGYDAAVGTASVASSNTKVAQTLGDDGEIASRTLFPTGGPAATPPSPFSGNNLRSVIPTSATTFYASGTSSGSPTTGGVWYFDGSAFTQVSSTVNNIRNVEIYGDQLFFSTGAGSTRGIYAVGAGLPTTGGQTSTSSINMGSSADPYGFVFFDTDSNGTLDRAYVADSRDNNVAGGITRWDLSGGAWTQTGSAFRFDTATGLLSTATSSVVAIRGLTGSFDSATSTATLYATTTETSNNRAIRFLDTGTLSTTTVFTTLATADANNAFRGIDFTPDTTPPLISSLSPADNATGVAFETNLVATFDENIAKGTGEILVKKSSDNSTVFAIDVTSAAVTVSGASLTVDPPANLANSTEYYVQIPGTAVRDVAGNAFAGITDTTSWSFTTADDADTTPPVVIALAPVDGATGVAVETNLVMTFNENILQGTGDIVIRRSADDSTAQTIDVTSSAVTVSGDTVTINPPSDLEFLTGYYVQVPDTAFRDAAGNFYSGIADTTTWDFTTINDTIPPTVLSIDDGDANNKLPVNTTLTYTIIFSEDIDASTVDATDFDNEGTALITIGDITEIAPGTFQVQVTPFFSGTLTLRIPATATINDTAGNALVVPVSDNDTLQVFDDGTPPTVQSITDDRDGTAINANLPVVYTIQFSETIELSTVTALDFRNAGTASIAIGSIAQELFGVVTVTVTPTSAGTLQLLIPEEAVIEDTAGNALVPPVLDDTVITVNPVTTLTAGDIAFTGIQSDNPDTFSFVLLKDVVDGTRIVFTDNRWSNATGILASNENTLTLTFANAGAGFAAGTHFVNTNGGDPPAFRVLGTTIPAGLVTGSISGLATDGDALLAYQGPVPTSGSSAGWIAGINTRAWSSGESNNESELPTALTSGVNAIQLSSTSTDVDNGAFQLDSFVGSVAEIRSVVNDVRNWTTDNAIGPISSTNFTVVTTASELFLNEVVFDPPAETDTGEEFIELRGTPGTYVPGTAYLLLLEGDSEDGPGNVDHRFYLGGMQFGSNGYLVLRQFNSTYVVNADAAVVTATSSGWGASWSSRATDIENGSVSVLLILATAPPAADTDVDSDNDGNLDGEAATWTIRDAIGNIDGGASDTGYGILNTSGNGNGIVPTDSSLINLGGYHPDYMARNGTSTGYTLTNTTSSHWVVGELAGAMPDLSLATSAFTRPSTYAGSPLDHIGALNLFVSEGSSPSDITLSNSTIPENAGANAVVGTLSTTDGDAGDTFTYSLVSGDGDADNGAFNIDGAQLRANASFNFEADSSYTVRIRSTDAGGLFFEKAFTITVTDVNEAPTNISLSAATILERAVAYTTAVPIGTLAATDPDASDSHDFELIAGVNDNALFSIADDVLSLVAGTTVDFETKPSYTITVRATDAGGLSFEKEFVIAVVNRGELQTVVIGDGTAQRSMVKGLTVTFDSEVTIGAGAFEVVQRGATGGAVGVAFTTQQDGQGRTVASLTFSGTRTRAGSLVDGNYELRINGNLITDAAGALDLDRNGSNGGTYVLGTQAADRFYRHFGDVNGNRLIDLSDLTNFRAAFGSNSSSGNWNPRYDENGNNSIDLNDLNAMKSRFGRTLGFE